MIKINKYPLVFFLLVLSSKSSFSQTWNLNLVIVDDSLNVEVILDESTATEIDVLFNNNVFEACLNSKIELRTEQSNNVENKQQANFKLAQQHSSFSYTILNSYKKDLSDRAFLDYGIIKLLNFNEILFESNIDEKLKLSINVYQDTLKYNLGEKSIREWKLNPAQLSMDSAFTKINNISFYTNKKSDELTKFLETNLKDFYYLENNIAKELVLLFAEDSLQNAASSFNDLAIIYIDSSKIESDIHLAMQKTILNTVFYWVSPFKIYPEKENKDISKNWLAEATPVYLSLKYLLLNKLISEEVFFNEFADKINLSNSYNSSSLSDMSMGIYKNPEYKNAFYSKGALAVFLLELKLFSFSKGEITFLDLLNNEMPEMDEQAKLELNNLLFDLENELVETKDSFDYNEYFKDFGFKYSEKEIQIEFNKKASLNEKNLWLKFNNK